MSPWGRDNDAVLQILLLGMALGFAVGVAFAAWLFRVVVLP